MAKIIDTNSQSENNIPLLTDSLYKLVVEKIGSLERENTQLKNDLMTARAKLEVYERLLNISDSKISLGFGPPIIREGDSENVDFK